MRPLCYWLLDGLTPVFFNAFRRKSELLFTSLLIATSNIINLLMRHLWRHSFFSSMRVSPSLERSRRARTFCNRRYTIIFYYLIKAIIEKRILQEVLGTSFLRRLAILLCKHAIAFSQCLKLRSRLSAQNRLISATKWVTQFLFWSHKVLSI